jgi:3-hydroxyacyl-[acyl-carrier-protein] dehydratase
LRGRLGHAQRGQDARTTAGWKPALQDISNPFIMSALMSQSSQITEAPAAEPATILDINQIQQILPHRYPFLLIDRVTELERKQRIVALKNVSVNEPFFAGHFPGYPIMPGVLIVEAIAQAGGALLLTEVGDRGGKLMFFTGIERAKFRRPVVPGDQLRIEVEVLAWRQNAVRMQGKAYVEGKLAAEAIVTCQLVSRPAPGEAAGRAKPVSDGAG